MGQGIESLRHVRRGVETSERLSPPVKTQVLWDLDKMTEDVQRLHASGLAPNGRAALLKALQLRFAVLLSPSFWRAPIRRSLISLWPQLRPYFEVRTIRDSSPRPTPALWP